MLAQSKGRIFLCHHFLDQSNTVKTEIEWNVVVFFCCVHEIRDESLCILLQNLQKNLQTHKQRYSSSAGFLISCLGDGQF